MSLFGAKSRNAAVVFDTLTSVLEVDDPRGSAQIALTKKQATDLASALLQYGSQHYGAKE